MCAMYRRVAVTFILGLDCLVDCEEGTLPASPLPLAPIFAIETPAFARAGVPFSLNAWVSLADPAHADDEIVPGSFEAEVDPRERTITVTGYLRRGREQGPRPRIQRALVVGIRVVAPAGTYTVCIPEPCYVAELGDGVLAGEVPTPRARQLLVVEG